MFDHAQANKEPTQRDLQLIAAFQHTPSFFSSVTTLKYAYFGIEPKLPEGRNAAEKRGRRFFIDVPPTGDFKAGLCAGCHSGPMLNETNEFIPAPPFKRGGRFQSVGVSEFNTAGNPRLDFVFTHPDGTTTTVSSPDPGRALITGNAQDFESLNTFKIPSLWGAARRPEGHGRLHEAAQITKPESTGAAISAPVFLPVVASAPNCAEECF